MKVRELMAELARYHPEAVVAFWTSPEDRLEILSIYPDDDAEDEAHSVQCIIDVCKAGE